MPVPDVEAAVVEHLAPLIAVAPTPDPKRTCATLSRAGGTPTDAPTYLDRVVLTFDVWGRSEPDWQSPEELFRLTADVYEHVFDLSGSTVAGVTFSRVKLDSGIQNIPQPVSWRYQFAVAVTCHGG